MSRSLSIGVIGGGTVALYVAAKLAKSASVTVFEADAGSSALDLLLGADRVLGSHAGSTDAWMSAWGGTSKIWGGQLLPWERWEFDGLTGAPWPLSYEELLPHYEAVRTNLGLPSLHRLIHEDSANEAEVLSSDENFTVRRSTWMTRKQRDFTRNASLSRELATVRTKRGATVDRFEPYGDQFRIHYQDRASSQWFVDVVDRVVIAAGTLGNVRVLAKSLPTGSSEVLGRGFMDHVSARVGQFQVSDWDRFRQAFAHRRRGNVRSTFKLVATPQLIRRESVLPAYAHWEFDVQQSALRQLARGKVKQQTIRYAPRELVEVGGAAAHAVRQRQRLLPKFATPYLRVDVEQAPDVTRSIAWRSNSGEGHMEVQWDVNDAERASIARVGVLASERILGANCGVTHAEPVESRDFVDTKHMMGGARMGRSAADSVVDPQCQIHGMSGAWVAGASVFPSGGVANPTFTALALADRMAGRID